MHICSAATVMHFGDWNTRTRVINMTRRICLSGLNSCWLARFFFSEHARALRVDYIKRERNVQYSICKTTRPRLILELTLSYIHNYRQEFRLASPEDTCYSMHKWLNLNMKYCNLLCFADLLVSLWHKWWRVASYRVHFFIGLLGSTRNYGNWIHLYK